MQPSRPPALRERLLKAFIVLYLWPLTALYLLMTLLLQPFGSILWAAVYGPQLLALWITATRWRAAAPGMPPLDLRGRAAYPCIAFLLWGLFLEGLGFWRAAPESDHPFPRIGLWLAIAGIPAALFALAALWQQWRRRARAAVRC